MSKLTDSQTKVLKWIRAGCNYNHGVMLYEQIGRNESLKRLFPGKSHRYASKLMYELCKSAGLDLGQAAPAKAAVPPRQTKMPHRESAPVDDQEDQFDAKVAGHPRVIRRVIMEYAELFQERSKTHALMVGIGESNAEGVKVKRKELFDTVKALTIRLETLYAAREQYEKNGEVPTEESLWPKPKAAPKLPDDVDELKKMKKNQQTANTKDQTMLDYQAKKKGDKKNPLPAGPKRMKLENRIKARSKKIEEIEYKLNSMQG
ncbi:hypothetical protein [Sunxiuqinia sp. sy24]|uniref:hypothetical protein n=1 Tax=Sunxiuqinia sp. sy24 TaxID=3461495 RepID=UPI0040461443